MALTNARRATFSALTASALLSATLAANEPPVARLAPLDFGAFGERSAPSADVLKALDAALAAPDLESIQLDFAADRYSAEALTAHLLERIEQHDARLRSFIALNPHALDEARAADSRRKRGAARSPLDGIPVAIKDNIETAPPLRTTVGSVLLKDHQAARDAPLVKQLREAGAVILGKTNLSELAGVLTRGPRVGGTSAIAGESRNPFDQRLPTCGSSAGSAVALAAGLTVLSVGTETSGSIICPSAWLSLVGMKPSRGLVSGAGIAPLVAANDSAGPMARSVIDAALLLAAIDRTDVDYRAALALDALAGKPVGVLNQAILSRPFDRKPWRDAITALQAAGAHARPVALADDPAVPLRRDFGQYIGAGMRHDLVPYVQARRAEIDSLEALLRDFEADLATRGPFGVDLLKALAAQSKHIDAKTYAEMSKSFPGAAARILDGAFERSGADVLLSLDNRHSLYYATAGYPTITVPLGLRTRQASTGNSGEAPVGLPVGATLIGRPGQDAQLLAMAYAFEQASLSRARPTID